MRVVIAFASGLLFGAGLLVSHMADPAKVLNFLDVARRWDPSLAFVMGGGLIVTSLAFALARRRARPLVGSGFPVLPRHGITMRLTAGASLFGVGWGLIGLCPGPALVALPLDPARVAVFVIAMLAGLWGARLEQYGFKWNRAAIHKAMKLLTQTKSRA
ncbi:YeeE/YedE family protein [Acidiphilium sp. AL]|uniref:YeeE/YedE family protein n=1 Tax=Acidiphilium iwatense TaxID=768198 RepID=A0ABS9DWG7_9PROT|nr:MULTISPECIES: DUF6691 family protein [Acidiphilium]MCF3947089.1 YeeE/YedE family protein [Acidiphilium iwatense]MCU4160491.1 YeeE/YedE family protein [Acidiphilium sp. AL]